MIAFIFVLALLITLIVGGMYITFYLYTHGALGSNRRYGYIQRLHNADGSDIEEETEYAA